MSNKEEFLQSCLVLDTETNSDDYMIAEIIESGFVIREGGDWTKTYSSQGRIHLLYYE